MKLLLVMLISLVMTCEIAEARPCPPGDSAPAWREEARRWLLRRADAGLQPVDDATLERFDRRGLCIRKNNYWCQKQTSGTTWKGTTGADGCTGNRDDRNHAIFESAAWGARAGAQAIRTSFRRGLDTALKIAAARSPACDTLGSPALWPRKGPPRIARSCSDAPRPPSSWAGPFCPAVILEEALCVPGCNCPPRLARSVLGPFPALGPNDRLPLFDDDCRPLPGLVAYLQRQAETEIGLIPSEEVIRAGIALMDPLPAGSCRARGA